METENDSTVQNLISLASLARELGQIGKPSFSIKYPHPFLLKLNDPMAVEVNTKAGEEDTLTEHLVDKQSYIEISETLALTKSLEDTYTKRITVGRSKNNDIVLLSPKVSKLHCTFQPMDNGASYHITDMGSVNGTWVNKMRLRSKRPQKLKNGDKVAFWRFEFEFMDLVTLIAQLKKSLQKT